MGFFILVMLLLMLLLLISPWLQEKQRDRMATGIVIATEVKTHTGSYGKRYTRKVVTYEFEDERGKKWRGQIEGDRTLSIPEGTPIQVHYQGINPINNKGTLPDRQS